jgi:Cu/Ag efflux protein CusF
MNRWLTLSSGFVAVTLLSAGLAFGQQPKPDCKAAAPAMVEGQVVRVDKKTDKVTIRDKSGATHEFQSNKETTKDLKAGDTIEARLREAPKC